VSSLIPEKESLYRYEILGSSFIALLEPLEKEEDLASLLGAIKDRYPKASHYCYAAKVLSFEACTDDGEPSRSAGVPLLDLLHKKEIAYGLIVVVRYFGGTKLGAARLARTYRETAAECLNQAAFAEIIPGLEEEIEVDYPTFESLKKSALRAGLSLKVLSFGERVRLLLTGDAKIVSSFVSALPNGSAKNERSISVKRSLNHDSKQ
jgi:putative IMPACT (imprinted ancient) family translation regulator